MDGSIRLWQIWLVENEHGCLTAMLEMTTAVR